MTAREVKCGKLADYTAKNKTRASPPTCIYFLPSFRRPAIIIYFKVYPEHLILLARARDHDDAKYDFDFLAIVIVFRSLYLCYLCQHL
jgi:hypothetical protein